MGNREPTVRSRELGEGLRQVMRHAGLSGREAARRSDCVEVATTPDAVLVRDSKDRDGPALAVPTPAWRAFLTTLPR